MTTRDDDRADDVALVRVPARVGMVGNPSDGFGGAVLAAVVPGLAATVQASRSPVVRIRHAGSSATNGPAAMAGDRWWELAAEHGHDDEQRIISAALWTLMRHLDVRHGADLTWSTTVPRSVGLAGSSALAVATIDAVCAAWEVVLDRRLVAALALAAEVEVLGIAAGWQDRIVQSVGGIVLVDTATMDDLDGVSVPVVHTIRPATPLRVVVGWSVHAASPSDGYHAVLRRTPDRHAAAMLQLADLARGAAASMVGGDVAALAAAVEAGWQARQAAAPLRADHAALVDLVRAAGVAATTPGSGGSVVAVAANESDERRAIAALRDAQCAWLSCTID